MELAVRLLLTPLVLWVVAVVARRLGPGAGGRLVGLPLTTGPFLVVVALADGPSLAASAARGVVAGQISVVAFCATYAHVARRLRPRLALAAALGAGLVSALALTVVTATWVAAVVVVTAIAVCLSTWPPVPGAVPPTDERRWETPVRMTVSGSMVAGLSGAARVVGPQVAGVLSSAPVILSVMTPTTHRSGGPSAAVALTRSAVASMPASVVFSAVLAYALNLLPPWPAFLLAGAALLAADALVRATLPSRTVQRVAQSCEL